MKFDTKVKIKESNPPELTALIERGDFLWEICFRHRT